jgi:hypothetical protein
VLWSSKLDRPLVARIYKPSPAFVCEARSLPLWVALIGYSEALPPNIRQGSICSTATNTLAYYAKGFVTNRRVLWGLSMVKTRTLLCFFFFFFGSRQKVFFLLGNGKQSVDNVKLFFPSLLKLRAKKLACLSLASIFILV